MWRFLQAWPHDRSLLSHNWFGAILRPLRVAIVVVLALSLCGCVNYDVGFNVRGQSGGEFVQVIRLGAGLGNASGGDSISDWVASLEQRTKSLKGQVRRRPNQSLELTIPFRNSKDLDRKFNQFFGSEGNPGGSPTNAAKSAPKLRASRVSQPSLPSISAHLDLTEQNYLLFLRDHFRLDLDLRPLSLLSSADEAVDTTLINPGSLLDLSLQLTTPWGSRSTANSLPAQVKGQQLHWQLQPGKLNHLEATYWMPSPIGWGAFLVIGLVALASWLRGRLLPLVADGAAPIGSVRSSSDT